MQAAEDKIWISIIVVYIRLNKDQTSMGKSWHARLLMQGPEGPIEASPEHNITSSTQSGAAIEGILDKQRYYRVDSQFLNLQQKLI